MANQSDALHLHFDGNWRSPASFIVMNFRDHLQTLYTICGQFWHPYKSLHTFPLTVDEFLWLNACCPQTPNNYANLGITTGCQASASWRAVVSAESGVGKWRTGWSTFIKTVLHSMGGHSIIVLNNENGNGIISSLTELLPIGSPWTPTAALTMNLPPDAHDSLRWLCSWYSVLVAITYFAQLNYTFSQPYRIASAWNNDM